jgi:hypothetical protein
MNLTGILRDSSTNAILSNTNCQFRATGQTNVNVTSDANGNFSCTLASKHNWTYDNDKVIQITGGIDI